MQNTPQESSHWNKISCIDSLQGLKNLPTESVHLILSDIPYGIGAEDWDVLHSNSNSAYLGTSPAQEKAGGVFKSRGKPLNGWSEADKKIPYEYQEWCSSWANEWQRILKPGGSAIVFAGRRLASRFVVAMEDSGFTFKDTIAWLRPRATHRAQRISLVFDRRGDVKSSEKWKGWRVGNLRPTFEPIHWLVKPYKIGGTLADNLIQHELGAFNEESFIKYTGKPENVIEVGFGKNETGYHPTQKPLKLMTALIELTTLPGQIVLDPFCGSGSTLIAAKMLNRNYLGFDSNIDYCNIAKKRLEMLEEELHSQLEF
jgi:site-specific DNA-methyltransferase (adenine-specific)